MHFRIPYLFQFHPSFPKIQNLYPQIHGSAAEAALQGKSLSDPETLRSVLQALDGEVKPEGGPLESADQYRIQLVKTLLYKVKNVSYVI